MFTRFDIARKVYHIFISTRKTFEGFAHLGLIPDCNCAFDAVQDEAMAMLELMFPEIDYGYFESFFYEVGEIGSEAEFIAMLEELSEQKDSADINKMKESKENKDTHCNDSCDCSCHNKEKSNKNKGVNKSYSHVYAVTNIPTQEEIERAIRILFGADMF